MKKAACILAFGLFSATAMAQNAPPPGYGPSGPGYGPNYGDDSLFDGSYHHRQQNLSVMLWIPWYYGFGAGVDFRYNIPVVSDGFIPNFNDEFDIEPSLGIAYTSYGFDGLDNYNFVNIAPAAYAIYALHLNRVIRVYAGLGLGVNIGVYTGNGTVNSAVGATYFYWDPVAGVNFQFTHFFGLRAEVGAQGLKGGLQFYF